MTDPYKEQWEPLPFLLLTIISSCLFFFFFLAFVSLIYDRFIFPSFAVQVTGTHLFKLEMVKNQDPSSELQMLFSS